MDEIYFGSKILSYSHFKEIKTINKFISFQFSSAHLKGEIKDTHYIYTLVMKPTCNKVAASPYSHHAMARIFQ